MREREKGFFLEAGMSEIHMICIIAPYISLGKLFEPLKYILNDSTEVNKEITVEGFTETDLFKHVNNAIKYLT